ncbi:MAG: carboxy terminal-processing peptidase, partial [Planctomycetaceae bacterium]
QNKGVTSDIVLPSLLNHREIGEESMDNALEFDRIERARYSPYANVNDALVEQLSGRSRERVGKNDEFVRVEELSQRYLERRDEKTISLNEATLRAEEEALKQEKKEEEEAIQQANGSADKDIFPEDFYNRELVNISADYLSVLESLRAEK